MRLWTALKYLCGAASLAAIGLMGCTADSPEDEAAPRTTPAPRVATDDAAASPTLSAAGPPLRIVYIPRALGDPIYKFARSAAEETARELDVDLQWVGPVNEDAAAQAELVRKLTARGVDGIAISASDPAVLGPAIDAAIDAGVAVVCWDRDVPESKRLAFYGINDYQSGVIAGRKLGELVGGKGKVAILSSSPDDAPVEQRVIGVRRGLSRFPDLQIAKIVYCGGDASTSIEQIRTVNQSEPELAGWVFAGPWPFFSANGLEFLKPGALKIVAFESLPPCLDALRRGIVQALIGRRYFEWGREPLRMLTRHLRGGEAIAGPVDSGVEIVTPDDVDEYEAEFAQSAEPEE